MRIVTLLMTLLVVFLFISCDEKKNNTDEGSVVTVTAAYVENGSTIVVEGTNFGETAPTAKLTKVGDTEDAEELTVEEFNDTLIKFTLPVTFGEGSYILAAVTENGDFTVTLVGLKGEDGVDGTDGVEGPKGDKGDQGAKGIDGVDGIDGKDGEPGLDGEDGIDGKDGEPGTDSVCAGNTAPVITKIDLEKAPGKDFRKDVPIKMTLETQDADGDTLAIIFTGMGATIKPEIDGTYTVTPTMLGGPFMFGVILNDGCQTVTGDFTLDKVVTSNDTDNQSLYILTSSDLFILWPQDDDGEQIGGHGLFDVVGLAINPLDGKMYTFSNDGNILYELDRNTAESTLVCELEESVYGLTFGPDGTLYAAMDSGLFSIDISKCTAEWLCDGDGFPWSAINSMAYGEDGLYIKAFEYYVAFKIDIDSNNVDFVSEIYFPDNMDYEFFEMEPGLAYNYANGKFYSAAYDDDYGDDYLVVIDSSWIATTVMTLPGELYGMVFSPLDKTAPDDVENVTVEDSGCNYIYLTWEVNEDDDIDFVWVTWTPNGPAKPFKAWDIATIVEGIKANTEYTFLIRTVDYEGNISEGETISVTTEATCPVFTAPTGTLYFITGAGGNGKSLLYTLDPATLATTLIGDTGILSTTGLAVNPLTGKMYVTSYDTNSLYEVNPATAEASLIGAIGYIAISDITFGPDGTLYGWDMNQDLLTINTSTGAATPVAESTIGTTTWLTGMAFDDGTLFVKMANAMYTVDPATGIGTHFSNISGVLDLYDYDTDSGDDSLGEMLAVGSNGYHYSVQHGGKGNSYLYVIDPSDWTATFVGDIGIKNVTALDFMPLP